jgi:flagellar motor switch protein FliN/FliY
MSADTSAAGKAAQAEFAELPRGAAGGNGQLNLDLIMDVRLALTLEVGRARISVRNLLGLTQGSVVELDKLAGEPLDVLVNGTLVAHGEVVVVNEKFGIRITDVVSPAERIRKLK